MSLKKLVRDADMAVIGLSNFVLQVSSLIVLDLAKNVISPAHS